MKTTILSQLMIWRQRAHNGDRSTVEECGHEYGDSIARLVRHIVRTENFNSEIGCYVQTALNRLQQSSQLDRIGLIDEVTQEVCTVMAGFSVVSRVETLRASREATMGVRFAS